MIRWKLKLRGSRSVDGGSTVELPFVATRGNGLKALRAAQDIPRSEWTAPVMFGWLVYCHEDRFKGEWRFTADKSAEYLHSMKTLIRTVGAEEAAIAIRITFSHEFRWVTFPIGCLLNPNFYGNFLQPAIARYKEKKNGEQAEWTGGREGKGGEVNLAEVFRE